MKVTGEMLQDAGACQSQIQRFEDEWPTGVEIGLASIQRAEELELDTYWFASHFLDTKGFQSYCADDQAAWKVYEVDIAIERKAYDDVIAATEEARCRLRFASAETRAEDAAHQAYIRAEQTFVAATAPALKAYYVAGAVGLARAVEAMS